VFNLEYNNLKYFSHLRHELKDEYRTDNIHRLSAFLKATENLLEDFPNLVIIAVTHGCMTTSLSKIFGVKMKRFHYCGTSKLVFDKNDKKLKLEYFNKKFY